MVENWVQIQAHSGCASCFCHFGFFQLKFMWGNLAVGSGDRWREVSVPFLQPGQVRSLQGGRLDFCWFCELEYSADADRPLQGRHRERGTGGSLCGRILHLPLASGPRRGTVWTQGVVQHRGGSSCPRSRDGWWDLSVALCDATGRWTCQIIEKWRKKQFCKL